MSLSNWSPPATRITHLPTGLQATSDNRSEWRRREDCYKVLNAKIEALLKGQEQNNEVIRDYIEFNDNPFSNCGNGVAIDYRIPDKIFNLRGIIDGDGEEFEEMMRDLKKEER